MKLEHFTKEQLIEIAIALNLPHDHLKTGTYKVRDGFVKDGDWLWWRGIDGPERFQLDIENDKNCHFGNLKNYPECYQIAKPELKVTYLD